MPLLELTNVTKRFGGLVAVDGVSLNIDSGEMIAIVGPNGAGKTTLFNTLSGVHLPDAGRILFDGHDITHRPPHRRAALGLGRTFQIPRPFGAASVRENIAVGAMFGTWQGRASVGQAMHVAEQYAELLGLQEHLSKLASTLTPIENKRLGIARALAMRPKLLLLDEAMAGMNSGEIDEMIDVLRAIRARENIAIVGMVEHIMRAVVGLAERVIVMHQGAVLVDAPTEEALGDPQVVEVYLGTSK